HAGVTSGLGEDPLDGHDAIDDRRQCAEEREDQRIGHGLFSLGMLQAAGADKKTRYFASFRAGKSSRSPVRPRTTSRASSAPPHFSAARTAADRHETAAAPHPGSAARGTRAPSR